MTTDGFRPHRMSEATIACGEELLGWACQACGHWVREFGPVDRSECPIDWRSGDTE